MANQEPELQLTDEAAAVEALTADRDLATDLTTRTITPENPTQDQAKEAFSHSTVLEIGCGQGDMTVTLAYMVSSAETTSSAGEGRVIAVDHGPLDYGRPHTLGDAQVYLSRSKLRGYIQWVQRDPIEYLAAQEKPPDYIFLVHSLFYLPSSDYFLNLLRTCYSAASPGTKLLLAEWGMQYSTPEAEAHVLAVKVQMQCPIPGGNVRTVLEPPSIMSLAQQAGWHLEREGWIKQPAAHDGEWEVGNVRKLLAPQSASAEVRKLMEQMEDAAARYGEVKCVDVWTSIWKV